MSSYPTPIILMPETNQDVVFGNGHIGVWIEMGTGLEVGDVTHNNHVVKLCLIIDL